MMKVISAVKRPEKPSVLRNAPCAMPFPAQMATRRYLMVVSHANALIHARYEFPCVHSETDQFNF